jgi:catechol 2,3-dioxygenase-like lactoylglutathione lyase family enzyme
MFRVQRIDHVELNVPDRYEAAKWYQEVFGLEILRGYEFWAKDGPVMIATEDGNSKLALFEGTPPGFTDFTGFHRVAFGVDGAGFLAFLVRLETLTLLNRQQKRLTAADVVDHIKSWSIYFLDPYGYRFELTTYDYEEVKAGLNL